MSKCNYTQGGGSGWDKDTTEKEREISSYKREWFWGGTPEQHFLVERLLTRVQDLEETVGILTKD